jgi:hypothetical protein
VWEQDVSAIVMVTNIIEVSSVCTYCFALLFHGISLALEWEAEMSRVLGSNSRRALQSGKLHCT